MALSLRPPGIKPRSPKFATIIWYDSRCLRAKIFRTQSTCSSGLEERSMTSSLKNLWCDIKTWAKLKEKKDRCENHSLLSCNCFCNICVFFQYNQREIDYARLPVEKKACFLPQLFVCFHPNARQNISKVMMKLMKWWNIKESRVTISCRWQVQKTWQKTSADEQCDNLYFNPQITKKKLKLVRTTRSPVGKMQQNHGRFTACLSAELFSYIVLWFLFF